MFLNIAKTEPFLWSCYAFISPDLFIYQAQGKFTVRVLKISESNKKLKSYRRKVN